MSRYTVSNAYYAADIGTFLATCPAEVLGEITRNTVYPVETEQRDAWVSQVSVLHSALAGLEGAVFLEFDVPRLGSRLDAALISGPAIFPIEFKVGEGDWADPSLVAEVTISGRRVPTP